MQKQALSGHPASQLLCGHLTCSLDARGRSVGPTGSAWSCLGSVMCWKLSCLLSMEFFPCKKNPCSALPCSAAAPGLSSRCCESVLPRGSAEVCGNSSPSEWERSVENFPGSTPVLPCCEPDLSLSLHPSEGGWFGSLGMDPGHSSSCIQLSQGSSSRVQGAKRSVAAVPLPGHVPSLPPLGAGAVSLPLLRAWMDSWLSPFRLEQPKSLTWCKKSWCHLPAGLTLGRPLPCQAQGAAGKGRDGVALHLACPVLYPLVLEQKGVENCWLWGPG